MELLRVCSSRDCAIFEELSEQLLGEVERERNARVVVGKW